MLIGDEWLSWSNEAINIGEQAHKCIFRILQGERISHSEWQNLSELIRNCLRAFMRWWMYSKFHHRDSEMIIYSITHGYAGTVDAYGTIKQHPVLIDWKSGLINTGSRLQLGAYYLAFKEIYPRRMIRDGRLVYLDKKTGHFREEIISETDLQKYAQDFVTIRQAIGII